MTRFSLLTLLCLFCSLSTYATVYTVSQNGAIPAQYTSAQTAHNIAAAGDTLYIHGDASTYGNLTINKKITIIGTGYAPMTATTNYARFTDILLQTGSTGTHIIGVRVDDIQPSGTSTGIDSVVIERCLIANFIDVAGDDWLIRHNFLDNIDGNGNSGNEGTTVTNNIFSGGSNSYSINRMRAPGLVANNTFISPYSSYYAMYDCDGIVVINNIMYGGRMNATTNDNSIFNNNLTYDNGAGNMNIPYGSSTGSGNVIDQNPLFVNGLSLNPNIWLSVTTANNVIQAWDFSLAAGSPGQNLGTDGSDVGVHGGSDPMPLTNGVYTGEPGIPQVRVFSITNPVVGQGNELHFQSDVEVNN